MKWIHVRTVRKYKTGKTTDSVKTYLVEGKTILKEVRDYNYAAIFEKENGITENTISVFMDEALTKNYLKTKFTTPKEFKEYEWPENKQLTIEY